MGRYEIKDINGNTKYTVSDSMSATGCYYAVKNEQGYAEIWYDGACIFKTR